MAIKILMPALSPTMTKGNLAKWLKKEGDVVKPGDVLAEIETDKATMEVESADGGILGKILVPDKSEGIKVNELIGVLLEKGEDASSIESLIKSHNETNEASKAVPPTTLPNKTQELVKQHDITSLSQSKRIFASPLAKRIAEQKSIDINNIVGTGPRGRIIKDDVINLDNSAPQIGRNPIEYKVIKLSQMRRTIAERLQESKSTIPHFYLTIDCDITEFNKAKNYLNSKAKIVKDTPAYKISINDMVIKAAALALVKVPQVNSGWVDDGIVEYNNVDISVAIALSDGLITPIIQNADQKSFVEISSEMKSLSAKAKSSQLKPHEFMGGSFTISNLGMYGIKEFQAIINLPQSCILAIGSAEERPVVKNNFVQSALMMSVSMSCDHRVVDGAIAAKFMQEFKSLVEQPITMFI